MAVKHDDQPAADRLAITASNFGPIDRVAVQLRPLTVFAGPSNTGKTWLAMLLYALHRFASRQAGNIDNTACQKHWQAFSTTANGTAGGKAPPSVADQLTQFWSSKPQLDILHRYFASCDQALGEEICRCQGLTNPANLASIKTAKTANGHGASIRVRQGRSLLQKITIDKTGLVAPTGSRVLQKQIATAASLSASKLKPAAKSPADAPIKQLALASFLDELHKLRYGALQGRAWCLPANRSGIMRISDVLAGALVERTSCPSTHIPLLAGGSGDFLDQVFDAGQLVPNQQRNSKSARPGGMAKIARLIEDKIIGGKIVIEHLATTNQPTIRYRPKGWKRNAIALPNTSAMVSELAALVILLRYHIEPGDVLIFEKAESNLHPAKQIKLVEVIAAIVNAGVKVIMSTHSDLITEKLSAVILTSQQPQPPAPGKAALREDQVGVWVFQEKNQHGSVVKEVTLGANAIYDTGYMAVSHRLYEEWHPLLVNRQENITAT